MIIAVVIIIILSAVVIGLLIRLYRVNKDMQRLRDEYGQRVDSAEADREQLKNDILHITHDLRTPLTSICGYIDIMKKKDPSADFLRYLCLMSESTESMKQFTESLAKYAYIFSPPADGQGKAELHSIMEKSLLEYYSLFTKHNVVPQIDLPEGTVTCSTDSETAGRIISIVIGCAAELGIGEVTAGIDEKGVVTVSFLSCCGETVTAERLLNKFYIIGKNSRSSGSGLYIAKRLAEKSGGSIAAERCGDKFNITVVFP